AVLNELAFLQASAAQVNLEDMATLVDGAFEAEASRLMLMAESAGGDSVHIAEGLADARSERARLIKEAAAENINVVAEQMQSGVGRAAGGDRPLPRSSSGEADNLQDDAMSCVETALAFPPDADMRRELATACAVSGRAPAPGRCP